MQKNSPFTWCLYWSLPIDTDSIHFIRQFHQSCGINARECFHGPDALQIGRLGVLFVWWPASFWLQWTMAEGTVHGGSPANLWGKPTVGNEMDKYTIKHGLRPIGLSPSSWQSSLGLGSMSRYSAHIYFCISNLQHVNYEKKRLW